MSLKLAFKVPPVALKAFELWVTDWYRAHCRLNASFFNGYLVGAGTAFKVGGHVIDEARDGLEHRRWPLAPSEDDQVFNSIFDLNEALDERGVLRLTQHPADLPLHKVFRRAMGRAGIVEGYMHVCRRKDCGFKEQREVDTESTCPKCSMKLWAKPLPRQLRFHDTRHSTAALLLKAKVPLAIVQKVLRHSDPATTSNIYGNIGLDDLRDAVNVMGDQVRPHLQLVSGSGETER